jgi:ABC-type antimicrobial peptide transport system permease subunit
LGFPLFWYFAKYGYQIPKGYDDFGIQGFSEPIYFSYPLGLIGGTLLFVFVLTAVVSWLPTRKIARLNPVDALRGKVN